MSSWSNRYIGLTFDGSPRPCWALARLVYLEEQGIELPTFGEAVEAGEQDAWRQWRTVVEGSEAPFDLAMFMVLGEEAHTGIVTAGGQMIHCKTGSVTSRAQYRNDPYWSPMLSRFLRHEALVR
jgi:cell wall-associated NlpC family hydrolase